MSPVLEIVVASGGFAVGAALGWCSSASALVSRWAAAAGGSTTARRGRAARARWTALTGASAAAVSGVVWAGNGGGGRLLEAAAFGLWASGLSVLGLVDAGQLVLPTPLTRLVGATTASLLAAFSAMTGNWAMLARGLGCAAVAGLGFGLWALARPKGLGFGDVRMGSVAALGVGALSPAAALVVLSGAPLVAGAGLNLRPARRGNRALRGPGSRPAVPLGPFLAIGAVLAVVTGAR